MGADDVSVGQKMGKRILLQFLEEGNATIHESVVDYLSKVLWEESLKPEGSDSKNITEALKALAPLSLLDDVENKAAAMIKQLKSFSLPLREDHSSAADSTTPGSTDLLMPLRSPRRFLSWEGASSSGTVGNSSGTSSLRTSHEDGLPLPSEFPPLMPLSSPLGPPKRESYLPPPQLSSSPKLYPSSGSLSHRLGALSLSDTHLNLSFGEAADGPSDRDRDRVDSRDGEGSSRAAEVGRSLDSSAFGFTKPRLNPLAAEFVPTVGEPGDPAKDNPDAGNADAPAEKEAGTEETADKQTETGKGAGTDPVPVPTAAPEFAYPFSPPRGISKSISFQSTASDDEFRRNLRAKLPANLFGDPDSPQGPGQHPDFPVPDPDFGGPQYPVDLPAMGFREYPPNNDMPRGRPVHPLSPRAARMHSPPGWGGPPMRSPYGPRGPPMGPHFSPPRFPGRTRERPSPFMDMPPHGPQGGRMFPLMGPPSVDDAVAFLSSEFPQFPVDNLADIFMNTGGDLYRTMEILTQVELQDEPNRSPVRRGFPPPPSLTPHDFPSLSGGMPHGHMEDPMFSPGPPHRGPGGPQDFASVVRKGAGWAMDRDRAEAAFRRGARSSWGGDQVFPPRNMAPPPPPPPPPRGLPWLETGDALADMYSDLREEAREHATARNIYFDQATQAYLAGNKALAKELSSKGRWHAEQMFNAHSRAADATFRHRNMASGYLRGAGAGGSGPPVLDLHGLHVTEALSVLKREMAALRSVARSTGQRQQLMVCVGTGHHAKGRVGSRLAAAVERALVEEERAQFQETVPGMFRVIV